MAEPTVASRVLDIVRSHSDLIEAFERTNSAVVDETTTLRAIGFDELDVIEITMQLEEEFGIELADEDVERVETVGDLVALVRKVSGDES